jgi:hypothetical protein
MKYPIRSMFQIRKPGNILLAFDLSQAETWCVAALAREQNMFHALRNGDIHAQTGVVLFHDKNAGCPHTWAGKDDKTCNICGVIVLKDERYVGKRYNHASSYRMGSNRAAEVINKDAIDTGVSVSLAQSKTFSLKWHSYYHLKGWWDRIEYALGANNRTLTTVYGFERTFFGFWGDELFKEATAFEPQSTVADHAFGAVHPDLGIEGGIIGIRKAFQSQREVLIVHTGHDSVTIECPAAVKDDVIPVVYKNFYRPLIVNEEEFWIPVDGEMGERWGEMEAIKLAS